MTEPPINPPDPTVCYECEHCGTEICLGQEYYQVEDNHGLYRVDPDCLEKFVRGRGKIGETIEIIRYRAEQEDVPKRRRA